MTVEQKIRIVMVEFTHGREAMLKRLHMFLTVNATEPYEFKQLELVEKVIELSKIYDKYDDRASLENYERAYKPMMIDLGLWDTLVYLSKEMEG